MSIVEFTFYIKNTRKKQLWLLAYGLLIVNALLFFLFALKLIFHKWIFIPASFAFAIALFGLLYKNKTSFLYKIGAVIVCIGWIKLSYFWLAIVMIILLSIVEYIAKDTTLIFNQSAIMLKAVLNKKYQWNELQNVVLKDGLLTIDFRNNKLLQLEIDNLINEKEFNEFCQQQLTNQSTV
ncbi:MAG: hypothetical protein KF781_07705 [Chitinophagaceae bacterium]|nr:hypothetical protein [Chitinophagaceae bacterium]MCW5905640.1 hypothetical protein [Chitinophagaceae bacterium]